MRLFEEIDGSINIIINVSVIAYIITCLMGSELFLNDHVGKITISFILLLLNNIRYFAIRKRDDTNKPDEDIKDVEKDN